MPKLNIHEFLIKNPRITDIDNLVKSLRDNDGCYKPGLINDKDISDLCMYISKLNPEEEPPLNPEELSLNLIVFEKLLWLWLKTSSPIDEYAFNRKNERKFMDQYICNLGKIFNSIMKLNYNGKIVGYIITDSYIPLETLIDAYDSKNVNINAVGLLHILTAYAKYHGQFDLPGDNPYEFYNYMLNDAVHKYYHQYVGKNLDTVNKACKILRI